VLGQEAITQPGGHLLPPAIQATPDHDIAHRRSCVRWAGVQEVLDREQPAVQLCDRRPLIRPGSLLGHDGLQACELLRARLASGPPFLSRLACTVAYVKG
jgi:hypothetical protein